MIFGEIVEQSERILTRLFDELRLADVHEYCKDRYD